MSTMSMRRSIRRLGLTLAVGITTIMMIMSTEVGRLLNLMAWLSPAFPVGGFAYSHGLEWAVEVGDIRDGDTLRDWVTDVLVHGSARSDVILLRAAHAAWDDPVAFREVAEVGLAVAPARERREEALNQGRAFGLAVGAWARGEDVDGRHEAGHDGMRGGAWVAGTSPAMTNGDGGTGEDAEFPYSIAVGVACGRRGVDVDVSAAAYLQAFAANLISAAVRLVPLGQTTGLRVLAALEPVILAVAEETRSAGLDDLGGCAFRSDLAAMRHETQYTRLFRS
jgi:urease accessory protein